MRRRATPSPTKRPASRSSRARRRRSRPGGRSGSSPSAAARPRRAARGARSWAATPSCDCSRTCSTPRRASAGSASSRSRARRDRQESARPGSSRSTWMAWSSRCWWHEGRSPAYGEGITFWALGEMVRSRAKLLETDDPVTTRARIAEVLAEYVPDEADRRRIEPALLASRRRRSAGRAAERALPAWRRSSSGWRQRAGRARVRGPPLGGPGTLDFIEHLLEWSRNVPILIVTLARPELRRASSRLGRRQAGVPGASTSSRSTTTRCGSC